MRVVYDPALSFDDVLLEPQLSMLDSRKEVSLDSNLFGSKFTIPIISSNMNFVTGPEMCKAMYNAGGLGILHRFANTGDQQLWIRNLKKDGYPTVLSVGARNTKNTLSWLRILCERYDLPWAVCIDVAHGHMEKVVELVSTIKKTYPNLNVIAGNVSTPDAFFDLSEAGADAIKVGQGGGSVCTTRIVTGAGVPQLQALMDCYDQREHQLKKPKIISDGGAKNSGDLVKALAAGADFIMTGFLLAGTNECPGPTIKTTNGKTYRNYMGQSSFGINKEKYTVEGVTGFVEEKGPVRDTLFQLEGGIKSGMSYVGARNLQELRDKAVFRVVTTSSLVESNPRIQQVL
jgi:IMP dehydrogenase